jgi:hypothetical protein
MFKFSDTVRGLVDWPGEQRLLKNPYKGRAQTQGEAGLFEPFAKAIPYRAGHRR